MNTSENSTIRDLALDLLGADSEHEVIEILKDAGYWDDEHAWRLLGDDENNFKTVGAQQARSDSALVEKIVNSVDARLTAECMRNGIDPSGPEAPESIQAAVNQFFLGIEQTEIAKEITVCATGARAKQDGMPCITICDTGEGQTPFSVPDTFMSIDKKNKLRIPFVQGKFNMGGTGALVFCGKHKIQLLITRRHPELVAGGSEQSNSPDNRWSFTVIRRESPPKGRGNVRNPYFKYLAPVGATEKPGNGDVLAFFATGLKMMPNGNQPYEREMKWGSCIKLYNYDMRGYKGHILRKDGLLSRLEILLPEIALPVRIHECRKGLRGHKGSFDTSLVGLKERLEEGRGDNLEPTFPHDIHMNIQGEPFIARIYAFKGNNADVYRADQGVIFTLNGQTHGAFPKSFYERKKVKMGRLANALLIVVDSTDISVESRADLFKNSRDRLSNGDLRRDIEDELESQIANHPALRELRERRRREDIAEKLDDAKPLEDVLKAIIKASPSLSKLFLLGQRLSSPFNTKDDGEEGGGKGNTDGSSEYIGEEHPTYFRFQKLGDGEELDCKKEHGRRARFKFVTDATNDYFTRFSNRGRYVVEVIDGSLSGRDLTTSINLYNGIANWNVVIPGEDTDVGDRLKLRFEVDDDVILSSFENIATVELTKPTKSGEGQGKRHERSGGKDDHESGTGPRKGKKSRNEGDAPPIGLALPEIVRVRKPDWDQRRFDQYSSCTVIEDEVGNDGAQSSYTFYVNVDNLYLATDVKDTKENPELTIARFVYGNVLVGLALIHDENVRSKAESGKDNGEGETTITRRIEQTTRALAPFLLPMVEYLGGLDDDTVLQFAQSGDEE